MFKVVIKVRNIETRVLMHILLVGSITELIPIRESCPFTTKVLARKKLVRFQKH